MTNSAGGQPNGHVAGHSRPRYGVDAPYVPAALGAAAVIAVVVGVALDSIGLIVVGILLVLQSAVYLHTTLRGKFVVWKRLVDDMDLGGDERALDVGCGRGAVLCMVATHLPRGSANGIDLWRSVDQSGNAEEVTRANASAIGVSDRVELHTGDMTDMPFPDSSFDLVTSSLAIHNIKASESRTAALDEIVRVLRPGGRLVIADIKFTKEYREQFESAGLNDVNGRGLGINFWYGGPWMSTSAVTATKPEPGP